MFPLAASPKLTSNTAANASPQPGCPAHTSAAAYPAVIPLQPLEPVLPPQPHPRSLSLFPAYNFLLQLLSVTQQAELGINYNLSTSGSLAFRSQSQFSAGPTITLLHTNAHTLALSYFYISLSYFSASYLWEKRRLYTAQFFSFSITCSQVPCITVMLLLQIRHHTNKNSTHTCLFIKDSQPFMYLCVQRKHRRSKNVDVSHIWNNTGQASTSKWLFLRCHRGNRPR